MPEHPDFKIRTSNLSNQTLYLATDYGDRVELICDSPADAALLAAAIDKCLVHFEVVFKKGRSHGSSNHQALQRS